MWYKYTDNIIKVSYLLYLGPCMLYRPVWSHVTSKEPVTDLGLCLFMHYLNTSTILERHHERAAGLIQKSLYTFSFSDGQ